MDKNLSPLGDGEDEKGPMSPPGRVCDTRLGYKSGPINPNALPRSGRYGAAALDADGDDGREQGFPPALPRSGRYGDTDGGYDE
jgi:hypothetical protein